MLSSYSCLAAKGAAPRQCGVGPKTVRNTEPDFSLVCTPIKFVKRRKAGSAADKLHSFSNWCAGAASLPRCRSFSQTLLRYLPCHLAGVSGYVCSYKDDFFTHRMN